jgi:hypothetical protein
MIYFSMLAGILLFFLVITLTMLSKPFFRIDFSNPLFPALFILTCLVIPAGFYFSKKLFNNLKQESSLELKYPGYQKGLLIRLATCESICLFSIVCLLITENLFTLIFLFIALSVFIFYFPTPEKIGMDISLTDSEIELFV